MYKLLGLLVIIAVCSAMTSMYFSCRESSTCGNGHGVFLVKAQDMEPPSGQNAEPPSNLGMFSPGEGMMPPPDGDMGPPPDEDMGPPPDDMSTNSSQDNEQSQQQSSTSQTSNKVVMTHSSATHKSNQTLKLKSLVYIQGKVSEVMKVSSRKQDNTPGEIMLNLKLVAVDTEHLIMVGPSSYVEKRGFRFTIGDYIKVSGFTVAGEKNTLVAKEITKNKQILKLRNNEGSPLWSL